MPFADLWTLGFRERANFHRLDSGIRKHLACSSSWQWWRSFPLNSPARRHQLCWIRWATHRRESNWKWKFVKKVRYAKLHLHHDRIWRGWIQVISVNVQTQSIKFPLDIHGDTVHSPKRWSFKCAVQRWLTTPVKRCNWILERDRLQS